MKRSSDRILTTHAGALPKPADLIPLLQAKDSGQPYDRNEFAQRVRQAALDAVRRQLAVGIDVVDDGEESKSSFAWYTRTRLGGFEPVDEPRGSRGQTRDSLAFPAAYADHAAMCAARITRRAPPATPTSLVCTGPVRYVGQAEVQADIQNLKEGLQDSAAEEGFLPSLSPNNLALYFRNEYYRTEEEFLIALADAMNEEYRAIVDAGFLVQVDDPRLATHYNRTPGISLEECRRFIATSVEAVNHALRGIPEEKVRFHTCYSVNVAPRVHDLELKHYVDLMLQIKAGAYSIEAANPRHEHEWQVWEEVELPDDRVLIPGVVSHCVALVEHPELVAQRIARFAGVLGRERVIAGNDCGFGSSAAGDQVQEDVAWAKLAALTEGARLATQQLWGRG